MCSIEIKFRKLQISEVDDTMTIIDFVLCVVKQFRTKKQNSNLIWYASIHFCRNFNCFKLISILPLDMGFVVEGLSRCV